jgi:tRNA (mo5U34)-methyltransferase
MLTPSTKTAHNKAQLEEMAESVGYWWHSIDLGQGVVTRGYKTPETLQYELESLRLPDLRDKTVLDIGAWDGFFSFEAERRGARRVVALDHYVWSLDLPKYGQYCAECKERGVAPLPGPETAHWQPDKLPGKRRYDTAHQALESKVETVVGDFMTMDLGSLGTFDVVFFLGVLYHMENPLAALRRVASLSNGRAIIETHAIVVPGYEHLEICEFYSSNQLNGDVSNWWGPNLKALEGMCRAAGFVHVEVVRRIRRGYVDVPHSKASLYRRTRSAVGHLVREFPLALKQQRHFRAIVHAWK